MNVQTAQPGTPCGVTCQTGRPAVHVLLNDLPIAPAGTALCSFHSPYDVVPSDREDVPASEITCRDYFLHDFGWGADWFPVTFWSTMDGKTYRINTGCSSHVWFGPGELVTRATDPKAVAAAKYRAQRAARLPSGVLQRSRPVDQA